MRTSYYLTALVSIVLLAGGYVAFNRVEQGSAAVPDGLSNPQLRVEWEHMLLQDPATGKVPVTRAQELAFARHLPKYVPPGNAARTEYYDWTARGPFNFGGRTRGAAMDVTDGNVLIAGSISGGIYRSTDQGDSWSKTTNNEQNFGITCLVQDTRSGKEGIWYAGSGEAYNSASQGSGARYVGDGMLKSIDSGHSWASLASTQTGTPQSLNDWDRIWRVVVDPMATEDVVLAAITGSIMRSNDGGESWTQVVGQSPSSYYSEIAVTTTGVYYATFSFDGGDAGIWRSTDGINWTNITPSNWPSAFNRVVIGINPSDEDEVYFMAETPGSGKQFTNFRGNVEYISFWKYDYISGDGTGAGGFWENRSQNLPSGPYKFDDLNLQGGYNMLITVKPDDPETVIIGGTNLFRSTSAFADSLNTTMIGGYDEDTDLPDFQIYENHHPDQHRAFFDPSNPDILYSANDGGLFRTEDINATPVVWESLNNGYNTTQFYTVAIDHGTAGSDELIGGLQDNGTFYANNKDPYDWKFPWSYDGAFTAIGDGGSLHLTSIQLGRMFKLNINSNGERIGFTRFDPEGPTGYYFIHPWAMDPNDNGIVYLPIAARLWRNDMVDELPFDSHDSTTSVGWTQLPFSFSGTASCVGVSTANPANRVYVGTASGKAYRIENANSSTATFVEVSNFLSGGGFMNCIAVDPKDGDHAMAIFSNYNVHSIYFTRDGGESWFRAGGNLEAENAPDGAPADLYSISTAPSIRWAEILHTTDGDTAYLVGTSVGLFGTNHLYPGTDRESDSTTWKQLAPDEIGNTVVMMIDSRESDGFVAVATHGAGMFSTHMPHAWGTTSAATTQTERDIIVYPNPATDRLNVTSETPLQTVRLCDLNGRTIDTWSPGSTAHSINTNLYPSGLYLLHIDSGKASYVRKVLIQ